MQIRQDPITRLWARSDGALCMPPSGTRFKKFRWSFGCKESAGYRYIRYKGKFHYVHRIVCRAFHGLPPAGKPFCDHKNRIKSANFASNLRWANNKENADNQDRVDRSVAVHGVRWCDDKKGYDAARIAKKRAQGLTHRKANGKWGWYPRINTTKQKE